MPARRQSRQLLRALCFASLLLFTTPGLALVPRPLTADQELVVGVAQARTLPRWLRATDRETVDQAVHLFRQEKTADAMSAWCKLVQAYAKERSVDDLGAVGRFILREALLESHTELDQAAANLGEARQLYLEIRQYITELTEALYRLPPAQGSKVTVTVRVVKDAQLISRGVQRMHREQLERLVASTEAERVRAAKLWQTRVRHLEPNLNQEQTVVATLSALVKAQYDTLQGILQHVRA